MKRRASPGERGLMMPHEGAAHKGCWMAWPYDDHPDVWGHRLPQAQACVIRVAKAIRAFEPVILVVPRYRPCVLESTRWHNRRQPFHLQHLGRQIPPSRR